MNGIEMQNKISIPIKTALFCGITAALIATWSKITNDSLSLFFLPGLSMGFFFALAHKQLIAFQKKWKVCVIFLLAYLCALLCAVVIPLSVFFEKINVYDINVHSAVEWALRGFIGTAVLLLLIRIVMRIRLKPLHIFILLVAGSTCAMFFYDDLLGNCNWIFGFAIWQSVIGGLLSFAIRRSPV